MQTGTKDSRDRIYRADTKTQTDISPQQLQSHTLADSASSQGKTSDRKMYSFLGDMPFNWDKLRQYRAAAVNYVCNELIKSIKFLIKVKNANHQSP